MGIELLSPLEQDAMRRAGRVAAATLAHVRSIIRAGMSTAEIDRVVRWDTKRRGAKPSQLGYKGFPAAVCTSRNDVVCHGIPSSEEHLCEGDIVNVDVTSNIGGFHGDTSATFTVGHAAPDARHVVEVARRCRDAGVAAVRPGLTLGELGAVMEDVVTREGCSVVRAFGGHGIGRKMHQDPHIPHFAAPLERRKLKPGMCFTIEPMVNLGGPQVCMLDDGWTVVTADGRWSAQFEHTVLVTALGCEVLTLEPTDLEAMVELRGQHRSLLNT